MAKYTKNDFHRISWQEYGEIAEKIKGTRLQEVMIEERPYIVIASTYLSPELISEKAPLYAPRVIRPGSSNSPF